MGLVILLSLWLASSGFTYTGDEREIVEITIAEILANLPFFVLIGILLATAKALQQLIFLYEKFPILQYKPFKRNGK
jgi:hypothetical protein